MPDILFILLLALIIFGPKKLPEIARQVGKLMLQFRQMSNELKSQLEGELLKIELEERDKKSQQVVTLPPAPEPVLAAKELPQSGS
jgi:sec-independent protein translocase protein TatB